jgi:hypothetical protein
VPTESSRGPAKYFDEEDDYDTSFELPEDDGIAELDLDALDTPAAAALAASQNGSASRERDAPELEDVPDFAQPHAQQHGEPAEEARTPAPAKRAVAATDEPPLGAHATPAAPVSHLALAQRARAHDLLARLRTYRGGAPAGKDQLGPFANVVERELGAPTVATLTERVWSIAPDQLSGQQMRALIQWGKTEAFAAEVAAVLDLLAAEGAEEPGSAATSPPAQGGRPAAQTASRGSGGAR